MIVLGKLDGLLKTVDPLDCDVLLLCSKEDFCTIVVHLEVVKASLKEELLIAKRLHALYVLKRDNVNRVEGHILGTGVPDKGPFACVYY